MPNIHYCFLFSTGFVRIENSQKDEVVVDGGRAMFLCHVTPLPHNLGKDAPVAVHWTFAGRRLDIDPLIDGEGHYISKSSENRHVLVITKARAEDEGEYACVATIGDVTDRAYRRLIVQRESVRMLFLLVMLCLAGSDQIRSDNCLWKVRRGLTLAFPLPT